MLSHDDEEYIKKLLYQLGTEKNQENCDPKKPDSKKKSDCQNLSSSQLLITVGLLSGVLEARSVLFNKDQTIEIVLVGSLKRKTQLDKVIEGMGKLPFEDVIQAILDNLT